MKAFLPQNAAPYRLLAFCALATLFLALAAPAFARPEWCTTKCTPSTPSWIVCTCPTVGAPVVSCGDFEMGACGFFATSPLPTTVLDELAASDALAATAFEVDDDAVDAAAQSATQADSADQVVDERQTTD